MRKVITLALKDLRVLSRDWFAMFWILAFPLMFALFFGSIMGGGGGGDRKLRVAVVDEDGSEASKRFVERLEKSPALLVERSSRADAQEAVRKGGTGNPAAYVAIKPGFGAADSPFALFTPADVLGQTKPALEVGIDPSRQAEAGYLQGVLMETFFAQMQEGFADPKRMNATIEKFLKDIDVTGAGLTAEQRQQLQNMMKSLGGFMKAMEAPAGGNPGKPGPSGPPVKLDVVPVTRDQTRPISAFEISFPSSVLWGILGCVTGFAISIVTERVGGTWLRLRVSPMSWGQLLAGKGLACFLACVGVSIFLLLVSGLLLDVRLGNPLLLGLAIICTAVCFVGIMMLLATLGKTEQSVAGAGWGIMMPLAMLGGGMVPLIAMPGWMLKASNISPIKWGIEALEGAIWRGFSFGEMLHSCAILVGIGVVCFAIGVKNLARIEG